MKKDLLIPVTLLLLITFLLSFGFANYLFLKKGADSLIKCVEQLKNEVKEDNWTEAFLQYEETYLTWKKINRYWPAVVNHEEMDRIEESMNKLKSYLQHEDSRDSLAEIYNLIYYINHIPEKELFNFRNVF